MIYWIDAQPVNAWWPRTRQPELTEWRQTPEYYRRFAGPEPNAAVRALKARERVYAAAGGGWGGAAGNPFNARIFRDE